MKSTRRMSKGAQHKFAQSWLERQGIEGQTVDTEALIDGSLSYEENIKLLKEELQLGGRSKKKATRDLSAAECDVAIGNYDAGFKDKEITKDACDCGHSNACDTLEARKRRAVKAKAKAKAKPKAKPKKAGLKAQTGKKKKAGLKAQTGKKKKATPQHTLSGKKKPQKKPKKKVKKCVRVKVKSHTRKCPTRSKRR